MNSPAISLDDKYTLERGRVYLTGLQALVRLPIMQRQRDLATGLNTAGYISGYRGSPLGGYDLALTRARAVLEANHVKFQPGLNEDLAATAIWGSQHTEIFPGAKYDGVFSIWYGKGPGVDRSGDVLKHGNFAGAGKNGGVLLVAGDDHGAKSSSMPHQSEQAFVAALIPVINPATVQEYLDLGLWAFAASRYSGLWIGFKAISDTVESSASVEVDPHRIRFHTPTDFEIPAAGLNIDVEYQPMPYEKRLHEQKLPALHAFARANPIDRVVLDSPNPKLGIVTTGKGYLDVRQALEDLGIDDPKAAELGLRIYKVALTWPIEPKGMLEFARGLEEIIVVEEKRGFIEDQLTKLFYNAPDAPRRIVGKTDENGRALIPPTGELNPGIVARALVERIRRYEDRPEFAQNLSRLEQIAAEVGRVAPALTRSPYFCSGCPHNTSTRVPAGSRAMAGIGCHAMAMFHPERPTIYATHMGGEGVNWIGHAPFTEEKHIFANVGDGTFDHSGLLAIRAAVAANVNITYKILYNDAVAMTGGQPLGAGVTVDAIVRQVVAEGVRRTVVASDEPWKYPDGFFPRGIRVYHRDELDRLQKELRETPGVTALVYDQTCAAEKRRRRKRGLMADPPKRAFINDLVCEGCGDCSVQSNCVSVQPLETGFGRKRRIDQSNCNKDFSCVKGFCPSFVTVHGGEVRRAKAAGVELGTGASPFADLPEPTLPSSAEPYGMMVTGIGGTGVITIGALLGMAAHIEGKGVTVLDQTGLAQKNGAVGSHVRIADDPAALHATRIAAGGARLLLGCDIVTASSPDVLTMITGGNARAVVNGHVTPPAAFVIDNTIDLSSRIMTKQITDATGPAGSDFVDATSLATALLGDSIASNLFMVGFAFQRGLIPLSRDSLERAVRLNGVSVDFNLQAFSWGRLTAHDRARVEAIARPLLTGATEDAPKTVDEIVERRVAFLAAYQDAPYAKQYEDFVSRVRVAERERGPGSDELSEAVARNLFKLMAYKDEYEVARLYTAPEFREKLERQFEGDYKLRFHLAPPLLASRDPETGNLRKREYGPWMMKAFGVLASLRGLRGSAFDVFGYTEERRTERRLIGEYRETVAHLLDGLDRDNYATAVEIASVPSLIKGFGHIKTRNLAVAVKRERELLARFEAPAEAPEARPAQAAAGD